MSAYFFKLQSTLKSQLNLLYVYTYKLYDLRTVAYFLIKYYCLHGITI